MACNNYLTIASGSLVHISANAFGMFRCWFVLLTVYVLNQWLAEQCSFQLYKYIYNHIFWQIGCCLVVDGENIDTLLCSFPDGIELSFVCRP